jgi:hypothetical protein
VEGRLHHVELPPCADVDGGCSFHGVPLPSPAESSTACRCHPEPQSHAIAVASRSLHRTPSSSLARASTPSLPSRASTAPPLSAVCPVVAPLSSPPSSCRDLVDAFQPPLFFLACYVQFCFSLNPWVQPITREKNDFTNTSYGLSLSLFYESGTLSNFRFMLLLMDFINPLLLNML